MVKATNIFIDDVKLIGQHLGVFPPDDRQIISLEKAAQFIDEMESELQLFVVPNPEAVAAFAALKNAVDNRLENPGSDEAGESFRQAAEAFQSAMTRSDAKTRAIATRRA